MVSSLPSSPGVYWFLDGKNRVLYVGKAKNLKKRLQNYTQLKRLSPRIKDMVHTAVKLQWEVLESELEALLIEAELIRLHQPAFNILLKDDKTPLYLVITDETYPRLLRIRKKEIPQYQNRGKILGPYQSSYKLNEVLKIARRIFPWCDEAGKKTHFSTNQPTPKACFYYHLQLCSGACIGKVSSADYQAMIKQLTLFLQGKKKNVVKNMTTQMKDLADQLKFEQANQIKLQLAMIEEVTSHNYHLKPELILPALNQNQAQHALLHLYKILATHLNLPKNYQFHRMEGYDVSNIMGKNASVSMVVFEDGQPAKDQYRLFNIKTLDTPNDYQMMKEALTRRQNHSEWPWPNLIIMDGGKGQVRSALSVWKNTNTPIIGLVKHPDRVVIPSRVESMVGNTTGAIGSDKSKRLKITWQVIKLPTDHPSLKLLEQVRDESHRFAKKQHMKLRNKSFIEE